MARRRATNVFSLTFLDIMSCGFGAVILIYIVINHGTETTGILWDPAKQAEAQRIEQAIEAEKINHVELRNTLALVDEAVDSTQASIQETLLSKDTPNQLKVTPHGNQIYNLLPLHPDTYQ